MFTIEEDSGTYAGSFRRHNGYFAGDFTRNPMWHGQQTLGVGQAPARPSRSSPEMPTDPGHCIQRFGG